MKLRSVKLVRVIFFGMFICWNLSSCKTRDYQEENGTEVSAISGQAPGGGVTIFTLEDQDQTIARYLCVNRNDTQNYQSKCLPRVTLDAVQAANTLMAPPASVPRADIQELVSALRSPSLLKAGSSLRGFAQLEALFPPLASNTKSTTTAMVGGSNSTGGKIQIWTTSNPPRGPLAKIEVLAAMNEMRNTMSPSAQDKLNCLSNDVPEWSDVMIHYYCQLPLSHRGCFTLKAAELANADSSLFRTLNGYTQAYNFCVDSNSRSKDQRINQSKTAFIPWISGASSRSEVFRYVMYSVGTKVFDQDDQDEIINTFYGVKSVAECGKRPQRFNRSSLSGCGTRFASSGGVSSNSSSPSGAASGSASANPGGTASPRTTGFNFEGTNWYISSDTNCNNFCSSHGGYAKPLHNTSIDSEICQTLVKVLVPTPPFIGDTNVSRNCNHGCAYLASATATYSQSCTTDVAAPNVTFAPTSGYTINRICSCKN